jgi:molybdopterin/thiamine biosynthesis adenylyltransferase
MACALGLPELASHNPYINELDEIGYHVDFVGGYFVIYGLPYLDQEGGLKYGDWASPVDLNGAVIDVPKNNHQAWWRGGRPHDGSKHVLRLGGGLARVTVTQDLITDLSFSFKLQEDGVNRDYRSFEEKVRTYLDTITTPAMQAHPEATPFRGIQVKAAAQGTPLRYPDTMSARYHMNDISLLLKGKKVAIIGLGGTGSYILDFIARTHLARIALFDDDIVHVHTIFRIPGFIPGAIGGFKVDALARQYGEWHAGLEPVPERITAENIERLSTFDFVFVSVDDGPARLLIVDWLTAQGIPYVDCGMGLERSVVGLSGFVRITGADRKSFEDNVNTVRLPTENAKDGEYRRQAQITELNALNAALAVIRFKQHFKLLDRLDEATSYIFDSAMLEIDTEGRTR